MPKLLAIRAIRYAAGGDLSTRIAPPYDVLDEGPKRELLSHDPRNIVAIDLPVTPPKTVGPDSAYEQAGDTYRQWLAQGVLVRDAQPALFAYEQFYTTPTGPATRRGLVAALGVEEFNRPGGGIFRHEQTIRGGTEDRLKLMRATRAQLSPVFAVYDDAGGTVREMMNAYFSRPPDAHGTTQSDGVEHRLWVMRDEPMIDHLQRLFARTDVFIADGHHRYTTALNYSREHPGNSAAAGCLFVLVAMQDEGLRVLPTHRVLCAVNGLTWQALGQAVQRDGRLALAATSRGRDEGASVLEDLPGAGPHAVGLYHRSQRTWSILTSRENDPLAGELPTRPVVWRTLDVAVLHELLVDRVLRPSFGGAAIEYKYPHEVQQLVRLCLESDDRLGVLVQPTPLGSVCEVARAGQVMPPKSTFFYPKLATGLVINPLE
jgi:uncharacterized protein (DUF1015 family)